MEYPPGTPVGTAGTPTPAVVSVQGITSMTALKVDPSGVTSPVSAASLPLPTGAALETGGNLATIAGRTPANGQATMANSRPVAIASDQGAVAVNSYSGASVALTTPAAALTASTDTSFTWPSQVKHWIVQNNSATAVGIALDTAATAGSLQVAPNGGTIAMDIPVTVLHMYSTAATNVNGSTGANIVLLGWS